MKRRTPLPWVRERTTLPRTSPLRRAITLEVLAFPPMEVAALPPPAPPVEEHEIHWPEFQGLPTPRERLEWLLQTAAEIEHALLVQYLYAAYSLQGSATQTNAHRSALLGIAIEEMSHLMTVQNLLLAIGSEPHLARQDFGPPSGDDYRLFPFDLMLEPLSKHSLAKYIVAESPRQPWPQVDAMLAQTIMREATGTTGARINRVGLLYALLGVFFGTKELLQQKAETGDAWYQAINELAERAEARYGGRDQIHSPDDFPFVNSPRQGTKDVWDRSEIKPFEEFRISQIRDRETALEALRDIGLQGEGPSTEPVEESHFMRFLGLFKRLFGPDGSGSSPVDTFRIPAAAKIPVDRQSTDPNAISHPDTVLWAQLADLRYALLLGFLEQYLLSEPIDREFLAAWCFSEMFHLKKLGQYLPNRDRSTSDSDAKAAPPFSMPAQFPSDQQLSDAAVGDTMEGNRRKRWPSLHAERLQSAANVIGRILNPTHHPVLPVSEEQQQFLEYMLEGDRRKLDEARARQNAQTRRTRFDRVREILELAAGTGNPRHVDSDSSVSRGRFWNLPLGTLKQIRIYGQKLLETTGDHPSSRSALAQALKEGFLFGQMPQKRSPVSDESIALIEKWIDDGCPDEPPSE